MAKNTEKIDAVIENEAKTNTAKVEVKTKLVVIPITENDKDTYVPVTINGNTWQVQKGVEVEVPEEVYNLLKQGGYLGIK